jgi:PAS domain S-box-containing protein
MHRDTLRVLFICDDAPKGQSFKRQLESVDPGILVELVDLKLNLRDTLREAHFDAIVVSDISESSDPISLASEIIQISQVPTILHIAKGNEEIAEEAFIVGVTDYIRKTDSHDHFKEVALRIRGSIERYWESDLYTNIVNGSREACSIVVGSTTVFGNQALADMVGVENPEDLFGVDSLDWIVDEDRERIREMAQKRQSGFPQPAYTSYTIRRTGGEYRRIESFSSFIRYFGRPGSLIYSRDVTEQEKISEALRESEEKYRSLIEMAPDGILVLDPNRVVTEVNDALLNITGYSREEYVGLYYTDTQGIPVEDLSYWEEIYDRTTYGEKIPTQEVKYLRKDGTPSWIEVHFNQITSEDKLIGYQAIVRDISHRKRSEEQLRRYMENLEKMVQERTFRLLEAERMSAYGQLSAMLSHDLRNPLTTIRNAAGLLRNPKFFEKAVNMIENNTDHAIQMLEELHSKTWGEPLQLKKIDVGSLLRRIIDDCAFPSSTLVKLQLEDDLSGIMVDTDKFRRVMENLVMNANESMTDGGTITVGAKIADDSLHITVADTGKGIPEKDLHRTFDMFYSTKENGIGLGLTFCKQVVEAHGGSIEVSSEVGIGTIFSVIIPVNPVDH